MKKTCPECGEEFTGRLDKKFCTPYCKSSYHYRRNRDHENNIFKKIDKQLKLNRRILKEYNKARKSTVRSEVLRAEGFNPRHFTHYWQARNKNYYFFRYEYGFMVTKENGKEKYVLVQWQPYMEKEP